MAKTKPITEHTGNKYIRTIHSCHDGGKYIQVDVYEVLLAFNITDPGLQHALKKLLCCGIRNKGTEVQDMEEAIDAINRSIEITKRKGEQT